MFSKLAIVSVATMAVFVAAAPQGIQNSCNTGPVQCCNSIQDSKSAGVTGLVSLLGVALEGVTGQVGLGCSPLSVIGLGGGTKCGSQPVCCSGNKFNGLINIGCSPINIGL